MLGNFLEKLSTLSSDDPRSAWHDMQAQDAQTNYLNDPAGTIKNVGAIPGELPQALGLRNDQQGQNQLQLQQQQAADQQRIDALQRIAANLRGVQQQGGDIGKAFDTFAPTLAGHGLTAQQLAGMRDQLVKDPTSLQSFDDDLTKARDKITAIAPGASLYGPTASGRPGILANSPYKPMALRDEFGNTTLFAPGAPNATTDAGAPGGGGIPPGTNGMPGGVFGHVLSAGERYDPSNPWKVSPKGAVGPSQIMPGTAPEAAAAAGIPFNAAWKTNVATNIAMGNAYYQKQLTRFGDPVQAAAAYNGGPGQVDDAIAAAKKAGDPSSWQQYLKSPETQAYAQRVQQSLANDPNAASSGGAGPHVLYQTGTGAAGGGASGLTPAGLKLAADRYGIDGSLPAGMSKQAYAMRTQIINTAAAGGATGNSIVANKADVHALTGSLTNMQKIYGQVKIAEQTALQNGQLFLQIAQAAPGQTQFPIANDLIQKYGGNTGNVQVRAMNAAAEIFAQEYGKAISGASGGSAALTNSAAAHARALIKQGDTPQAKFGIMRTLQTDMGNRMHSFDGQIAATRDSIAHIGQMRPDLVGGAPASSTTVHAAGSLTPGKGGVLVWSPH